MNVRKCEEGYENIKGRNIRKGNIDSKREELWRRDGNEER